ncbi:oleosin H2-like [Manihot esculenta]|uniref:oleosin H2-like n=1 Tax=Manihot esculenta TaxID=3983 RepID=UPI000B5D32DE|nr:oleosin H2-like [Manihot esculenta]
MAKPAQVLSIVNRGRQKPSVGRGKQYQQRPGVEGFKGFLPEKSVPSTSQAIAVAILLPLKGTLLFLAAFFIDLAEVGFLASGVFGITALSSLSWMANYSGR